MKRKTSKIFGNQKGAVLIWVIIFLPILIGMAAMAIDVTRLAVAKNELNNAADAGALAAARFLHNNDGTVNTGANQIGYEAARANRSENEPVEVNWTGGNEGDVQRGHWSFGTGALPRGFTANGSTEATSLWEVSSEMLDGDPDFINAVQVTARRQNTPIVSYFARIFGIESWAMHATATAYIGFAGELMPAEVDQPIAICSDTLRNALGEYSCSVGRMINSGTDTETNETGGWTSFNQDDACTGGTNSQEVSSLVCGSGNPDGIQLGVPIATNGGEIQAAFNDLIDCWQGRSDPTQPWNLTLPVVTCPSNNVGTCETVVGAVNLNIVWITGGGEDPLFKDAPRQMGDWTAPAGTESDGEARWADFVTHFNLQNVDGTPAPYAKKSIYFLPDCTVHEPAGGTGGENFGILARIPVLVE